MSFRVVDAHQHFWEPGRFDYPWMTAKIQPLVRPFLPEHLGPLLSQIGDRFNRHRTGDSITGGSSLVIAIGH